MNLPMVVKKGILGERAYDITSLLLENRIITLTGEINDVMAEVITSCLLYLDSTDTKPIQMYINSPGGSVSAGLAIYDTMRTIKSPVHTYCSGYAASMGAVLFVAGDRRFIMPNAEIMVHQPLGGAQGQCTDILINAEHLRNTKERLLKIIAQCTGKDAIYWETRMERDNWMNAEQAIAENIADEIINASNADGKRTYA